MQSHVFKVHSPVLFIYFCLYIGSSSMQGDEWNEREMIKTMYFGNDCSKGSKQNSLLCAALHHFVFSYVSPTKPQHLCTQALLLFSSLPSKLLHEKFKYAWGTSCSQTASQKVGTLNTISCLFNYRLCSKPKPPSIPLPWSAWFIMNALKQNTCSSPRWQIACLQVVCAMGGFP